MPSINEIAKEIPLPIWLCWGLSIVVFTASTISAVQEHRPGTQLIATLPLAGFLFFLFSAGLILYSANDGIKRRKEHRKEIARWKGEMAGLRAYQHGEFFDWHPESIDEMIGYLDRCIKANKPPQNLTPIFLFLAKEIKNAQEGKSR